MQTRAQGTWHQREEEVGVRVGKVTRRVTAAPLWQLLISARSAQSPYQDKNTRSDNFEQLTGTHPEERTLMLIRLSVSQDRGLCPDNTDSSHRVNSVAKHIFQCSGATEDTCDIKPTLLKSQIQHQVSDSHIFLY